MLVISRCWRFNDSENPSMTSIFEFRISEYHIPLFMATNIKTGSDINEPEPVDSGPSGLVYAQRILEI